MSSWMMKTLRRFEAWMDLRIRIAHMHRLQTRPGVLVHYRQAKEICTAFFTGQADQPEYRDEFGFIRLPPGAFKRGVINSHDNVWCYIQLEDAPGVELNYRILLDHELTDCLCEMFGLKRAKQEIHEYFNPSR